MPLDSALKRYAAIATLLPWRSTIPLPGDSLITLDDRAILEGIYPFVVAGGTARLSQVVLEAVESVAQARLSQIVEEVAEGVAQARLSQIVLEVSEGVHQTRLSQIVEELCWTGDTPIPMPRLPDTLAYGATGGPHFMTQVVMTQGGDEQRNQCWAQARGQYDIGMRNRDQAETRALIAFYSAVAEGRANTFLLHDFLPGEETGTEEPLGYGDGILRTFQLLKRYTFAGYTDDRIITRPRAGSVVCRLDGVVTTALTLDDATGRVTFTTAPGAAVAITADFLFDVPCRFDIDTLPLARTAPTAWTWDRIPLWEVRENTDPFPVEAPCFREVRLPDTFAYGATGGAMFSTTIPGSPGGFESPVINWSLARGEWELGYVNRDDDETMALIAFFRAVAKGKINGFRFHDFQEGEGDATDEVLGVGDGVIVSFQLVKHYVFEDEASYTRQITKPVVGTVSMALDGTPTIAFTVDTTTGLVTMDDPPAVGVEVTASYEFDVPVRLDIDHMEIQRVAPRACSWGSIKLVEIRDSMACASSLPAVAPVTAAFAFNGNPGTSFLALPHKTYFNDFVAGARNLTVLLITSDVLIDSGNVFYMQSEGDGSGVGDDLGASFTLTSDDATVAMGDGAALFEAVFSFAGWHCNYVPSIPSVGNAAVLQTDQGKVGIYVCTWNWEAVAMQISGSAAGTAGGPATTYNFCLWEDEFTEPVLVAGNDTGVYVGRNGGGTTEVVQDVPVPSHLYLGGGFKGRLYEVMLILDTEDVAGLHRSLVQYFKVLYNGGTPSPLSFVGEVLWYRGDHGITLNGSGRVIAAEAFFPPGAAPLVNFAGGPGGGFSAVDNPAVAPPVVDENLAFFG